jgi:hypothetical protein
MDTLHEDLRTFKIISRWILREVRNISDKSCRKNQNTLFFLENRAFLLYDMENRAEQVRDDTIQFGAG